MTTSVGSEVARVVVVVVVVVVASKLGTSGSAALAMNVAPGVEVPTKNTPTRRAEKERNVVLNIMVKEEDG
jgi:hypothetical protein